MNPHITIIIIINNIKEIALPKPHLELVINSVSIKLPIKKYLPSPKYLVIVIVVALDKKVIVHPDATPESDKGKITCRNVCPLLPPKSVDASTNL